MEPNKNITPDSDFLQVTTEIVSFTAYLSGVKKENFSDIPGHLQIEIYNKIDKNNYAKIIRNLCILRNTLLKNYYEINERITKKYQSFYSMTDIIPQDVVMFLSNERINPFKGNRPTLYGTVVELNRLISDRLNNALNIYPVWLNRQYMRALFIMPNGLNEQGAYESSKIFTSGKTYYPFQTYLSLNCAEIKEGNLYANDLKFLKIVYEWNHDIFNAVSKVSDASVSTKTNINAFVENAEETVMIVDCENSDPFKLCAVLNCFEPEVLKKISRIHLYDDYHSTAAWRVLDTFVKIPVQHHITRRIKESKSLVDVQLTAGACQEHYQNGINNFIIVASDSDYWGLITSLPDAEFLLMIEKNKVCDELKDIMEEKRIPYCYIDDFNTNIDANKTGFILTMIQSYLDTNFQLNIKDLYEDIIKKAYIDLDLVEQQQLYDRHIKTINMDLSKDGQLRLKIKK